MLPIALAFLALQHEEPKISVTTRLVEVSVVAKDKKGGDILDAFSG